MESVVFRKEFSALDVLYNICCMWDLCEQDSQCVIARSLPHQDCPWSPISWISWPRQARTWLLGMIDVLSFWDSDWCTKYYQIVYNELMFPMINILTQQNSYEPLYVMWVFFFLTVVPWKLCFSCCFLGIPQLENYF